MSPTGATWLIYVVVGIVEHYHRSLAVSTYEIIDEISGRGSNIQAYALFTYQL